MTPDHYKVLQVDPEAELDVIQAAYRRLAQKYHPDVATDRTAADRMAAINAAWSILRDPARRAAYDRDRAQAGNSPAPPAQQYRPSSASPPRPAAEPDEASPYWSAGRSFTGGGYDPATMRRTEGYGAAGSPPGNPSGTVLTFGRYAGWSLGEIARRDIEFLEWLDRMPIGRPYRGEIDTILRRAGRRRTVQPQESERRGLFRRR